MVTSKGDNIYWWCQASHGVCECVSMVGPPSKIWRVTLCLQDNQRDPTELLSDSHRPHRPTPGMKPRRMSDLYVEQQWL